MKRFSLLVSAFTLSLLGGCAGQDVIGSVQPPGHLRDAPQIIADTDWSAPTTIEIEVESYRFRPNEITLDRRKPYRFVLRNDSGGTHTFASDEFFQAIAVKSLGDQPGPYVEHVVIPAKSSKELLFVPMRPGHYFFECDIPGHSILGMAGAIDIR